MTLGGWILLAVIAVGIGGLVYLLNNDKSGAMPCCHCGQCIATGHCVMRARQAEKRAKTAKKAENPGEPS